MIQDATTEWVSFLDDDDTLFPNYVDLLKLEIKRNPKADVIHFREYFEHGQILPLVPQVMWSNVGIAFSVRRKVALKYPFQTEPHEDWHFLERIQKGGHKIHFSNYLAMYKRPTF